MIRTIADVVPLATPDCFVCQQSMPAVVAGVDASYGDLDPHARGGSSVTHPHETPPQPTKHPAEDEVELYEETEDVPGELSSQDLMDFLADVGLAEELNEPLSDLASLDDRDSEDDDASS